MTRRFLIGIAIAVAVCFGWLAWTGWSYLQTGYSLGVSMAGHSTSSFHIDFPVWRAVVHVLLWIAATGSIVAYIMERRWASTAAWLTFGTALAIGIYDVVQYGTIGSPTSVWTVLLLLFLALLTRFARLAPRAKA